MTYTSAGELIEILKKEKLWANKDYGQNFLVNTQVLNKITSSAEISDNDLVLEVGPGLGFLTQQLLTYAGHVRAIELDRNLIPYLIRNFGSNPKFELEQGTALKALLPTKPYKLVANIPYYITSPLLTHFLQPEQSGEGTIQRLRPTLIVILVQLEVAQKICATPGDHSMLSLSTQIFGKPSIVAKVSKNNFYPAPKVDSAILKIEPYPTPLIQDLKLFKQLTSICFHQKRKTLLNTLQNFSPGHGGSKHTRDKAAIKAKTELILTNADIEGSTRPQDLTIENWKKLIELYSE